MAKKQKIGKTRSRISTFFSILGIIFAVCCAAVGIVAILATATVATWLQDLPDYSNIDSYSDNSTTTIYASDGTTKLAEIQLEKRDKVSSEEIAPIAKTALVAVEDERFYEHGAIDPTGIVRAVWQTLRGNTQGASTLTQQLVRNTVLLDEMNDKTLERKVREIYIAIKLEEQYSKDEIITMYMNTVNFGNGNYGIQAAAQDYFGKNASELTLSEAALLVGIPNSPTYYNPRTNFDNAMTRRQHVLDRMHETGCITDAEYETASAETPTIVPEHNESNVSDIAPYFVDYVKQLLNDEDNDYGISGFSSGGYTIYTSLDVSTQEAANDSVTSVLEDSDLDGSLTAIDPTNGYIVAMVGGKDYNSNQYNLSTQMQRQPGSCFKAFTLIAAMEKGISPDTQIDSSGPTQISDDWTVSNAEGESSGYCSIEKATTYSYNTVYAHLVHTIGAQSVVDVAHRLGITTQLDPVESITLGSQGVNTLEMASAYATIAADGVYHTPVAITKIVNGKGETVYEHQDSEGIQVISPEIARKATEVLETVIDSGTGKSAKLANGQVAAGKTGTSQLGRDLWFCGYTPQLSAAVWTGYREEQETSLYGGTTSTPIWKKFMDGALDNTETQSWSDIDTTTLAWTSDWEFADKDGNVSNSSSSYSNYNSYSYSNYSYSNSSNKKKNY